MNTWTNLNTSGMAYLLAEDAGAPELRNPMNSGMHVSHKSRHRGNLLRILKSLIAMVVLK